MLELKNLSLSLSLNDRKLIENINYVLNPKDKTVIIGEEGNGKSTLLKLIYDARAIEGYCNYSGQIIKKGTMGYLPQMFPEDGLSASVAEYFADTEPSKHTKTISQMGLSLDFLASQQIIRTLSGGEKIKIQLAKILMRDPDILLLDEPTNDIDIATLEWLEAFINGVNKPIMFISHDETLIENTANTIIHIEQLMRKTASKTTIVRMGYAKYVKTRNQAFDKQMMIAKKQRADHKAQMDKWQQIYNRVEHEGRTIAKADRDGGGRLLKKKMKLVKCTGKRLDKQTDDFADIPQMEEAILTQFNPEISIPQGKTVLTLMLPGLFAGGRQLTGPIHFNVTGPQHVGIIGRNGVGKSTLLKEIWETMRNRADINAAYMPQDYADVLDYDKPVIGFLAADMHKNTITKVRTFLGSMKFTHDEMLGDLSQLSGGQKAKVLFLNMILQKADVLILDEPTRNFSPLSAPEIRKTLSAFGGAIISISHDRKYLSEVCERVYELTTGGLK